MAEQAQTESKYTKELGPQKVKGRVVARPERNASVQGYIPEIVKGLGKTIGYALRNTKDMALGTRNDPTLESISHGINTVSYPEQKRPYPERFRGVHRLTQREDGSPRCVACLCCSTACPAQCIHIEAGDYEGDEKREGWEKYPKRFVIDELRCIFCGYCVEACPCDAIRMDSGMHPSPYDSRDQFIYEKDLLLAVPGRAGEHETENDHKHRGDEGYPGIDRDHGH